MARDKKDQIPMLDGEVIDYARFNRVEKVRLRWTRIGRGKDRCYRTHVKNGEHRGEHPMKNVPEQHFSPDGTLLPKRQRHPRER